MASRWYPEAIYTDIDTIRNYAGEEVAYNVMLQKYIISYLLLAVIPFMILYAF